MKKKKKKKKKKNKKKTMQTIKKMQMVKKKMNMMKMMREEDDGSFVRSLGVASGCASTSSRPFPGTVRHNGCPKTGLGRADPTPFFPAVPRPVRIKTC